ncbi:MAG: hypothetical protein OXP28_00915 [Gammaproteobacteria bacterium]|nr:hypothetical protein [Gammaproteobacteria bacterium]
MDTDRPENAGRPGQDTDPANVPAQDAPAQLEPPSNRSIRDYLLYGVSLPERALRGTAGVIGGALRESAAALIPQTFRNARTYQIFVGQMLDFLAEDVGGVARPDHSEDARVENYVARKTVGNFIEMASLATVHLSPMLLLAIVSDLAYGSKAYLRELAEELEEQGVIRDASAINQVDDLLDAAASASEETAAAFDTPPLSVEGLRETVQQTRERLRGVDPSRMLSEDDIRRLWERMRSIAQRENMSPLAISGAVTLGSLDKVARLGSGTLTSVRVAGSLLDGIVLDHYRSVLANIDEQGLYPTVAASGKPYAEALWQNFATDRETITEKLLTGGAAERALGKARRWLKSTKPRS